MKWLQRPIVRNTLTVVAASMVIAGLGAVAVANEDPVDSTGRVFSNQFYVGLGAGISRVHPEADCNCIAVGEPMSSGFSLAIGYDFTSWLSAEVYGADLGSASIDFLGQEVGDVDYQVYGASVLGTFYRSSNALGREGLSLYARAGIGSIITDTDLDFRRDHPQHVAFGVGAEYGFRNGFAVRGELNSYDTDAQLLQVSLVKRFGGHSHQRNSRARELEVAPKVPEAPKADINPAPEPKATLTEALPKTYFDFDKFSLTPDALVTVKSIANVLKDIDGLIILAGHADDTGTESYNQSLSVRRANAVRKQLIAEGIDANRFLIRGFGELRPAASNATSEGRAQNRRVEVTLRAQ